MAKRFSGPVHLRLVGDKLAASKLVGRARTLLGVLLDVITPHGATSGSREYTFATGERIRVLAAGAIKVIEIFSPPLAEQLRKLLLRGFVCTVSYDDPLPTPISTYPQVVLTPGEKDEWSAWFYSSEFFFSRSTAKQKLTYGQESLNGLKHAGQIDWRSKEGIHISWHGPANRYWWSPAYVYFLSANAINPVYFGRKVYCAGKVLLDVDAYDTDNATSLAGFVMGAGLLKLGPGSYHLFVILRAQFVDDNDTLHRVVRYDCTVDNAIENDLCKLRVVNGTGQLLFTFNSQFSKSPWFFNEDCTEAVHMSDDRTFAGGQYREFWYVYYPFKADGADNTYPPPLSNRIVTLSLISTSLSSETVSVPVPGATGVTALFPYVDPIPVAVDFRGNERVTGYLQYRPVRQNDVNNNERIWFFDAYFLIGQSEYHLGRAYYDPYFGPDSLDDFFFCPTVFMRQIMYADLRNDFLVVNTEETDHAFPRLDQTDLYIYGATRYKRQVMSKGSLVWEALLDDQPSSTSPSVGGERFTASMLVPMDTDSLPGATEYIDTPSVAPRVFMNCGWNTAQYYNPFFGFGNRRYLYTGFLYDANPISFPGALRYQTYRTNQLVQDANGSRWTWAAGYLDGKIFVSFEEFGNASPQFYLTGGSVPSLTGVRGQDDPRAYPMFVLDKLPE